MSDSPSWSIVAKTLVQIQLRIVLAQQAEEAIAHADDCVHPSIDVGSERLLPRRPTKPLPPTRVDP
jgi:hypothetical protein